MRDAKKTIINSKGFSLVELIIVIAIIIILIGALVPKVVGYIRKAEEVSAMNTLKVMVDTMDVNLVEHALAGEMLTDKDYSYNSDGKFVPAGALTNWMLSKAQKSKTYNNANDYADFVISQEMLKAIRSEYGRKNPRLKFNTTNKPFGKNAKSFKSQNSNSEGAIFIYSPGGGVYAAQLTVKNYLVTYRNGNYTVQLITDPNAKFFGSETVLRNGQSW